MASVLTIRIDAALSSALEAEAARTGVAKGELVRAAIRERLAKTRPSALDALRDIGGIVDGPPDLSTNKRYLASLGRKQPRRRRR